MILYHIRLNSSWAAESFLKLGPSLLSFKNDQGGSQHVNSCQQKRTSVVYYSRGR